MSKSWFCGEWNILLFWAIQSWVGYNSLAGAARFSFSWKSSESSWSPRCGREKNTPTLWQMLRHAFVSADHRTWFQPNSMRLLLWLDKSKLFLLEGPPHSLLVTNCRFGDSVTPKSLTNCHPRRHRCLSSHPLHCAFGKNTLVASSRQVSLQLWLVQASYLLSQQWIWGLSCM